MTVPLSLFPLFKVRTSIEFDLLITTIERNSEWSEITYIRSIQDLWQTENQILGALLILFIMVLPGLKYISEILKAFKIDRFQKLNLEFIKKLVFVDVFLVSLLLIISYRIESLVIEAQMGLYFLLGSVVLSYVASFYNFHIRS